LLTKSEKPVQKQSTYFHIFDWLWLSHLGNEIDCCSIDKTKWKPSNQLSQFRQNQRFEFGPQVRTLILSEYTAHAVLLADMVSINYWNVIKTETTVPTRNCQLCVLGPVWRAPIF
jgi:hypothetical protein